MSESDKKNNRMGIFFVLVVMQSMASNFAHPVTPTLIQNLGLHSYMFGVAFAAMSFTNFLFSPFWGKVGKRISSKNVLCIGLLGYAVGQIFFCFAKTELTIFLARCLAGSFVGGVMVCNLTYVVNMSDEKSRGRNLTINSTIMTVAGTFGYLIGGFLGEVSITLTFFAQSFLLALTGILYFFCLRDDVPDRKALPKQSAGQFLKESNPFSAFLDARHFMTRIFVILFLVVLAANWGTNAFDQCFNYYIRDQFGFTSSYNGMIKAFTGIIALIANLTICMWLLKKTKVPRSTAIVLAVCSAAMLGVVMIGQIGPFFLVVLVFYAVNAIYIPLLQNCAASRSTDENSNMVMGFYNAMRSLGMIFGALVAGFLYDLMPKAPFIMACIAFLIAAVLQFIYSVKNEREAKQISG